MLFVNLTRGTLVCEYGVIADKPLARMRGLLAHRELPAGEGLLLTPASSIHTAFMRFPIDVVFLDADLRIIELTPEVPPWRVAGARGTKAVLELAAGQIDARRLAIGQQLGVRDLAVVPIMPACSELANIALAA